LVSDCEGLAIKESISILHEKSMNTRFVPGATGSLHIGHIYMALLNEHMAHDSGGKFHVRFCDAPVWAGSLPCTPEQATEISHLQLDELVWMDLDIDSVSYQSDLEQEVFSFLANSNFRMVIDSTARAYYSGSDPHILVHPKIHGFPLSTQSAVERVVYDYWEGSNLVIRGTEWISEHFLYMYFCALFGFPYPKCYYVPRLLAASDKSGSLWADDSLHEDADQREISKTLGNWRIDDFRKEGITPEEVRRVLREACLQDPAGPWDVDNLKSQPRLKIGSIEDVLRQR
jgi:hypothetical protein